MDRAYAQGNAKGSAEPGAEEICGSLNNVSYGGEGLGFNINTRGLQCRGVPIGFLFGFGGGC